MKREYIAGVLLLIAAAALYWRNLQVEESQPSYVSDTQPDFVARDLHTRSYDENGHLVAEIHASSMSHYQERALTEFTRPHYLVYPEDSKATWQVEARSGRLEAAETMTLQEDVVITAITPNEPVNVIKTESLALDLIKLELTTDAPIVAQGDSFTMQGTGLWADLNQNQFKLNSKVSASYEMP